MQFEQTRCISWQYLGRGHFESIEKLNDIILLIKKIAQLSVQEQRELKKLFLEIVSNLRSSFRNLTFLKLLFDPVTYTYKGNAYYQNNIKYLRIHKTPYKQNNGYYRGRECSKKYSPTSKQNTEYNRAKQKDYYKIYQLFTQAPRHQRAKEENQKRNKYFFLYKIHLKTLFKIRVFKLVSRVL